MQTFARIFLVAAGVSAAIHVSSQVRNAAYRNDTSKTATVEVLVVNAKDEPRKGETVIFIAEKRKKVYRGRTDEDGLLSLKLPTGDNYKITVKTFNDTSAFGTLEVPALAENQFYEQPFRVDIVYEPAKNFTLDNVEFDVAKATLRPSSYAELNELVEYLQWKNDIRIEIAGHTDNTGKAADNLKLSQQRAEAVRNYLLRKGIRADRVVAKGYGASQPIAENEDAAGRQRNRRTEVRVVDTRY